MVGVWIEPVTAQVMMTFRLPAMGYLPLDIVPLIGEIRNSAIAPVRDDPSVSRMKRFSIAKNLDRAIGTPDRHASLQ
jgi:hypothetical protein